MDEGFQHIGEQLRRITRTQNKFYPLLSGKVVAGSIDNENYTVDVLLTIDSDTDEDDSLNVPSEGVFLGCVSMNNNGILLYPADNSDVIIGSVDGDGNYTLLKCSNLLKVMVLIGGSAFLIQDGLIEFNNGSLGGLTKTLVLQRELNKVKTILQDVLSVIMGTIVTEPGSGAASALQAALKAKVLTDPLPDFSEIENTLIKQ